MYSILPNEKHELPTSKYLENSICIRHKRKPVDCTSEWHCILFLKGTFLLYTDHKTIVITNMIINYCYDLLVFVYMSKINSKQKNVNNKIP